MYDYQAQHAKKIANLERKLEAMSERIKILESERNHSSTLSLPPVSRKRGRPPKTEQIT